MINMTSAPKTKLMKQNTAQQMFDRTVLLSIQLKVLEDLHSEENAVPYKNKK